MKNFRTYQLSKDLYKQVKSLGVTGSTKDQLFRASQSICLNLAEGSGRITPKDRRRFYFMALGSLREVQAIIDIEDLYNIEKLADQLGAHLWKLCYSF